MHSCTYTCTGSSHLFLQLRHHGLARRSHRHPSLSLPLPLFLHNFCCCLQLLNLFFQLYHLLLPRCLSLVGSAELLTRSSGQRRALVLEFVHTVQQLSAQMRMPVCVCVLTAGIFARGSLGVSITQLHSISCLHSSLGSTHQVITDYAC